MSKEVINSKTNRINITNLYSELNRIEKRVNSLEVKNDSDDLHEMLNKTMEKKYKDFQNCNPLGVGYQTDKIHKNVSYGGVTAQEAIDNINNALGGWIDLDKTTPLEIINDIKNIHVQLNIDGKWVDSEVTKPLLLCEKILNGYCKYRYRLKPSTPIESIRITKELEQFLERAGDFTDIVSDWEGCSCLSINGRKVEIID